MKLWLDDERTPPQGWTWASNVEMAKKLVVSELQWGQRFEAASLDHDMGDKNGPDGLAFVDWMVVTGIWPDTKPTVHSMNSIARERMNRTINRYYKENAR